MKHIKSIRKYHNELCRHVRRIYVYLFLAIACFAVLTMYYADITVTGQFGLVFLDALFHGKPLQFYAYAQQSGIAPEGAVYDIGTYVIFGIWSLPVWLLHKFLGASALSVGSLLWFRLLVLVFYFGTIVLVERIGRLIYRSEKNAVYASFLYAISLSAFFPVFVASQYDALSVLFMLWGIYRYLQGNKKWPWIFAISMTIKPMTLLVLVILVLRKEKNIFRIVIQMLKGASLLLVCKLLYISNPAYQETVAAFLSKSTGSLFASSFNTPNGEVSLFFLALVLIYATAYLSRTEDDRITILMVFCLWSAFQIFGGMTCYWSIYLAPFLALTVLMTDKNRLNLTLLIQFAAEACMLIVYILNYSWVYGGDKTYSYLILRPLYEQAMTKGNKPSTAAGLLRTVHVDQYSSALLAAALGYLATIAVLCYRNLQEENTCVKQKDESEALEPEITPWHWRLRLLVLYGFAMYTLWALIGAVRN